MDFLKAMNYKDTTTLNNMPAHSTSGNSLVDFYFMAGSSRGFSEDQIIAYFLKSFDKYPIDTLRILFNIRDVRGGMGERRAFRAIFRYLSFYFPKVAMSILSLIPEYGRWDDVFYAFYTPIEKDALELIKKGLLIDKNGLCAKWIPREHKKNYKEIGKKIKHYLNLDRKSYRKLLSSLSKTVENYMCSNRWDQINYEHVPSVAFSRYGPAFARHDYNRFAEFLNRVKEGKAKINASVVFPHDLVRKILESRGHNIEAVNLQWKSLPDFVESNAKFLPICDVSGSMFGNIGGLKPIYVSVALSIYLAERNKSAFQNIVCTFSEKPQFIELPSRFTDDLHSKVNILKEAPWGMNTNLEAVFNLMLTHAKKYRVKPSDMPDYIIILSDMQFDQCVSKPSDTAYEMIRGMYEESGYKLPKVIFWNMASYGNFPVKFDQSGAILVSGLSPNIVKNFFKLILTPLDFVLEVSKNKRYDPVEESVRHLF